MAAKTLTGGAYIPPAKLKMLQQAITDKNSAEFQRLSWEALKKSIHGLVNKVNIPNIAQVSLFFLVETFSQFKCLAEQFIYAQRSVACSKFKLEFKSP